MDVPPLRVVQNVQSKHPSVRAGTKWWKDAKPGHSRRELESASRISGLQNQVLVTAVFLARPGRTGDSLISWGSEFDGL